MCSGQSSAKLTLCEPSGHTNRECADMGDKQIQEEVDVVLFST